MGQRIRKTRAYLQIEDRSEAAVIREALGELGVPIGELADLLPDRLREQAFHVLLIGGEPRSLAAVMRHFLLIGGAVPIVRCVAQMDANEIVAGVHDGISAFSTVPPQPGELARALDFAHARVDDANRRYDIDAARRVLSGLTRRQLQIVDGLFRGLTNKQLAVECLISERTVEVHRARIIDKMMVENTAGLIRLVSLAGAETLRQLGEEAVPRRRAVRLRPEESRMPVRMSIIG